MMPRSSGSTFFKSYTKCPMSLGRLYQPLEVLLKSSALLDQILFPYIRRCSHVILNSTEVIHTIQRQPIVSTSILVTLDVKSLYLKIPQAQGTHTVLELERLFEFILKDNFFSFADRIYRQRSGVAMGTHCAPNFTNLFMASLEENFLQEERAAGRPTPTLWLRYIDDIFLIWEENKQSLTEFVTRLNQANTDIQFTLDFSLKRITFLDLSIYRGDKFAIFNRLDFEPHRKLCHKNSYLRFDSCHPRTTFKSIIRGETICILRNCSDVSTYLKHSSLLLQSFLDRGYSHRLIKWTQDLQFSNRDVWLETKIRKQPFYSQSRRYLFQSPLPSWP